MRRKIRGIGDYEGYLEKTHRPLNCLAFVFPLILANLVGLSIYSDRLLLSHHLGRLLEILGVSGFFIPAAVVVVSLLVWQLVSGYKWKVDGVVLAGMVLESIAGTLPLFAAHLLVAKFFGPLMGWSTESGLKVLSGIGAGVYEEFVFRLIGVGFVSFVLFGVLQMPKAVAVMVSIMIASVLFSLYHFIGAEQYDTYRFLFRAAAGGYLAVVYLARGFAITVGTHACYNVMVALAW